MTLIDIHGVQKCKMQMKEVVSVVLHSEKEV